uniref:Endothelin-converting enzyme 2-like n=1 Tax=Drosophila rhopaloa TaxID=1041015 RepID=A0A6P4EQ34_DRORH
MKWIICLLIAPIVAASPILNAAFNNSNTRLLNNILGNVNEDASACGNYFGYACGNYVGHNINDYFSNINQKLSYMMYYDLIQQMDELHQISQIPGFNESSVDAKALRYYLNCLDAPPETRTAEHYLRLATPGKGLTWPHLTPSGFEWPRDKFKWMNTLANLHRYGLTNVIVNVEITRNSMLKLSMPNFKVNLHDWLKLKDFGITLYDMGVPYNRQNSFWHEVTSLEWFLEELTNRNEDDEEMHFMSVQDIEWTTELKWQRFIEAIVGHRISSRLRVYIQNLNYFTALRRMDFIHAELLANYIMTRFVLHIRKNANDGGDPIKCIRNLRSSMSLASSLLYKERFQDPTTLEDNIQEVEQIFDQLRRQLIHQVNINRLGLTSKQKRMVIEKVQAIVLNIGNIPKGLDHRSFVSRYYKDLEISTGNLDYAREHLKMLEFRMRKHMAQFQQPFPSSEEYFHMPDTITDFQSPSSPYYLVDKNIIVMPYPLLQEPFFVSDSHDVFKYSLMGFTLAHEMMHAIGTRGILVDSHGNDQDVGQKILSLPQFQPCLNTEHHEERLADIEGLKLAFAAYSSRSKQSRNDEKFTSVNLEKIFFLNVAQLFCTDNYPRNFLHHDDHPLRLQQIVNGFEPFERAFECPRNSLQCDKCEFSANVRPDVEAIAAAALSGMEMGSGPGSEGYEDADDEKSKAMENASQRLAVHRMTPTLEKSHLGGSTSSRIHNPGI